MSSADRRLHERALELAATRLDFDLAAAETAELEAHLGACPTCAHSAAGFRTDAAAIRLLAALPSRRVDTAVRAAIAGRPVRSSSRLLVLVAAAALLIVALLGVAAAGAFLLRAWSPIAIVPSPGAPAAVVVDPSASAAPAPRGMPVLPSDARVAYVRQTGGKATVHAVRPDGQGDRFRVSHLRLTAVEAEPRKVVGWGHGSLRGA